MRGMYSAVYVLNIVFQSIFTLIFNIGVALGISWLLVEKAGAPTWIYAVIVVLGTFVGIFSMIKFIISSMTALDNIEKSHKNKRRKNGNKEKKQ